MACTRDSRLLVAALGIALALLIGNGVIAYRSARTLAGYEGQVAHTQEVLGELQGVLLALDEAETGQRGYLLTDDRSYLAPYDIAFDQLPGRLDRLRQLMADNPVQLDRQAKLSALVLARLDLLRQVVGAQQAGQRGVALGIVRAGQGKDLMEQVRALVGEMEATERALLDQRTATATAARQTTGLTLLASTLGEVGVLSGIALLFWRNLRQREQIAAERARLLIDEQAARATAEAAVRLRDEFLGIASHELKNPLTALQGNVQLLQLRLGRRNDLEERERRMLATLNAQSKRIEQLIDTMLDVSRIDAGRLTIERAPIDLAALVGGIVEEVATPLATQRIVFAGPVGELIVEGDGLRLGQVVQNLLQNALRYSPNETTVQVRVAREGGRASIAVADRGMGIAPEALPHLFERFYRAPSVQGQRTGMGVGLFVVNEIVTLHGGEVAVESTEGEGSTFTVWLALAEQGDNGLDAPRRADGDPSLGRDRLAVEKGALTAVPPQRGDPAGKIKRIA